MGVDARGSNHVVKRAGPAESAERDATPPAPPPTTPDMALPRDAARTASAPAIPVRPPRFPPAISGRPYPPSLRRSAAGHSQGFAHWRSPLVVHKIRSVPIRGLWNSRVQGYEPRSVTTAAHRPPPTAYRPPATGYRPPPSAHRPPLSVPAFLISTFYSAILPSLLLPPISQALLRRRFCRTAERPPATAHRPPPLTADPADAASASWPHRVR